MEKTLNKWLDEGKISHGTYLNLLGEDSAYNSMAAEHGGLKISVLISTYKRSAYLVRLLNSIKIQQYNNCEIIIVDDASCDETEETVKQYTKEYPNLNIIYYKNEHNAGASASRKRAYLKATGDVIIFVDDDDYYIEPAYFSMLNQLYEMHSDCTMTIAEAIQCTMKKVEYEYCGLNTPKTLSNRELLNGINGKYKYPYIFAVSFKNTLLKSIHYEELLCFNHLSFLLYALLGTGSIYTINQAVGMRQFHAGNMTGHTTAEFIIANMEAKEDIYQRAIDVGLLDSPEEWHYRHLSNTVGYHFANIRRITAKDKTILNWMKKHFDSKDYYRLVAGIMKSRIRRRLSPIAAQIKRT